MHAATDIRHQALKVTARVDGRDTGFQRMLTIRYRRVAVQALPVTRSSGRVIMARSRADRMPSPRWQVAGFVILSCARAYRRKPCAAKALFCGLQHIVKNPPDCRCQYRALKPSFDSKPREVPISRWASVQYKAMRGPSRVQWLKGECAMCHHVLPFHPGSVHLDLMLSTFRYQAALAAHPIISDWCVFHGSRPCTARLR